MLSICYSITLSLSRKLYRKTSNISRTLVFYCWSLRCSWSIACRRCSNYIFILNLTPGFNGLSEDSCKKMQETFKFWDLVRPILEVLRLLNFGDQIDCFTAHGATWRWAIWGVVKTRDQNDIIQHGWQDLAKSRGTANLNIFGSRFAHYHGEVWKYPAGTVERIYRSVGWVFTGYRLDIYIRHTNVPYRQTNIKT